MIIEREGKLDIDRREKKDEKNQGKKLIHKISK